MLGLVDSLRQKNNEGVRPPKSKGRVKRHAHRLDPNVVTSYIIFYSYMFYLS